MAKQTINIGASANDGTGDPLRIAFDKVNSNFTELYNDDTGDVNSIIAGDGISVDTATGNVTVTNTITNNNQLTNGAGYVDGSGTANRLPKFTDADTIGNSTITDTGTKIGVNNANPTYSLDVYRNEATNILRLQNNTFSSWFGSDATGFAIETNLFKPITFKPSGVTAMTLNSSGNVGIGTSSPSAKLDVQGDVVFNDPSASLSVTSTSVGGVFHIMNSATGVHSLQFDGGYYSIYDLAASTERMRIDSSGNIGIGTSSPSANLDVNLNAQFNKSSTDGGFVNILGNNSYIAIGADKGGGAVLKYNSNGNLDITPRSGFNTVFTSGNVSLNGTNDRPLAITSFNTASAGAGWDLEATSISGEISLSTAGNEAMRIDSAGKVGIGTTSPAEKLSVQGAIISTGGITGHGANRATLSQEGANGAFLQSYGANTSTYGSFVFRQASSDFSLVRTPLIIDSTGNVGIGTTSPDAKLSINVPYSGTGSIPINLFRPSNDVTGYNEGIHFSQYNNAVEKTTYAKITQQINDNVNGSEDGSLAFSTIGNGTLSERMRITSGGFLKASNTGLYRIATGNFHELITNQNEVSLFIENSNSSPYGTRIEFPTDPNNTVSYFLRGTGNNLSRIIIFSNGNIINQNNSYGAISDIKLKENIVDASPKLDDLMQVKVRSYNLIGEETKQLGVVAQELEQVFPSMVSESPDTEEQEVTDAEGNVTTERVDLGTTTKSVKYSVFVPMLIKAMQEQQEIINDLKSRIETLENN